MYLYALSEVFIFLFIFFLHPDTGNIFFPSLAAVLSQKVCHGSLWDAACEFEAVRWSAYQWKTISRDGSDLHQTAVSEKGREGSLSLAAAFTLSSQASWRGIWNVSIDIPVVFVASVRQPGSANRNHPFTCIQHWQWCHRMTKSAYVVRCVCLCRYVFVHAPSCLHASVWLCVFSCECVKAFREWMGTGGSSRLQELLTAVRSPDSQPLIKHWHKNTATVCVWTVMKRRRLQQHTRCNLAQHELSVRACVCVCVLSICVRSLMRHICPQRCPLRYWGIHQV